MVEPRRAADPATPSESTRDEPATEIVPDDTDEVDADEADAADTSEAEPTRPVRRRSPARIVAMSLAGVVVLALVAVGVAVIRLQTNISTVDLSPQLGTDRPTAATQSGSGAFPGALTIAVFGDDTRSGDNGFVGGQPGAGRSDTTLVVHLNAAHTQLQIVSIPRDSMVRRPTCTRADGSTIPAALEQFNAAYTHGGAACSIRTIEQLTGVRIDEYVVVDFNGFRKIVDAVGGVEVCVPEAIRDRESGLDIPAGRTTLTGDQALAFVRTRYSVGDGSDLARIELQQQFLRSLASQAKSMNLVTDAPRLYGFLDALTASLTTSPRLANVANLAELAQSLQRLPDSAITFTTVPTGAYAPDPNRLVWTAAAAELWQAMREDRPFPTPTPAGRPTRTTGPTSGSTSSSPGSTSTTQPGGGATTVC